MIRARLAGVVGGENVVERSGGPPIVRPGTIEEVSAVVRLAAEKGLRVAPIGAGSRRDFSAGPWTPDLILMTTRLTRVVYHSPEDLTAAFECGIALSDLQRELGKEKQALALNPVRVPTSTLGGVLASNAYGPLRFGHGTARDQLIGCSLVRSDGEVVRSGGNVVKNVSGYDLGKLYVGSWGAFGILVTASFKLIPEPVEYGEILELPEDRAEALERARHYYELGFPVAYAKYGGEDFGIGFALPRRVLLREEEVGRGSSADARERPGALRLRLCYPPAEYEAVLDAVEGCAGGARETSMLLAGVTWLDWDDPVDAEDAARTVKELRDVVHAHGGSLLVERMPKECEGVVSRWRVPLDQARLMVRLKAALDPEGVFPPLPVDGLDVPPGRRSS